MARLESEAKVDNKRKKALGKELEASFRINVFFFLAFCCCCFLLSLFSRARDQTETFFLFRHALFGELGMGKRNMRKYDKFCLS